MPTKRKLKSSTVQTKDKLVESQTGVSKNDKRKAKSAGASAGNGTTGVPPTAQLASSTVSKREARAQLRRSRKTGTIPPTGTSSIPVPTPSTSMTNVAPQIPPVPVTTGPISSILSMFEGMIAACQNLSPLSSTSAPDSSESTTATPPVTSIIPGSSGVGLPALPPNWETRYIDTYKSSSVYQTFPVEKDSPEFQVIVGLLSPFRVTSVEQIINPDLWQSFAEKRKGMLRSKADDMDLIKGLGFGSPVVARRAKFSEQFNKHHRLTRKYGEYSANEALLLHCTRDQANLEKILVQGLDERLGGKNGLLGRGVYFSDDPEKCVQYDGTWGTILVFGVLLGDCLSVNEFPNVGSFVREPEKEAEQKRHSNDHFFDSITGIPQGRVHNEYVIFNRNQCYPFYLVKYQRAYREYPEGTSNIYDGHRKDTPIIAWSKLAAERVPMPKWPGWNNTWPFCANSIFKSMGAGESSAEKDKGTLASTASVQIIDLTNTETADEKLARPAKRRKVEDEECFICTNKFTAFSSNSVYWEELKCSHRLCVGCYKTIEVSRVTMSGMSCTSVRCPLCQRITGIAVGDCPDGLMTVNYISSVCDGYGSYNSIKINYVINTAEHQLNRTAYLPNSPEGKEILELLITAWDRKLTFMIGTSMTTGQQNVLVWNIHHKTSYTGGVQKYGYPDEGYFTRVKAELIAYGIE